MNISIITCHHVYNYGATLQAFALQYYLKSLGHNVSIIDYRLASHRRYEIFYVNARSHFYPIVKKIPFLKYFLGPIVNRRMFKTWKRKRSFDKFDNYYLCFSNQIYRNIEEIRKNPPISDVYIAGSDQIWNTDLPNGSDPGYYLDFGKGEIKRISYAASFGVSEIKRELEEFVKQQLQHFDKISVRERTGLKILEKLNIEGCLVVDPVFLLNKQSWLSVFSIQEKEEDYIFLYDFLHDDTRIRDYTISISKQMGLKIISINDYSNASYADIQVNDASPIDFIRYLVNAKYVISNSFHATAFSIILNKQFVTFSLTSQRNPSRMIDLLTSVGLLERFNPQDIEIIAKSIDWVDILNKYTRNILSSKQFLQENCSL